ncbi:hypothetical protein OAU50_02565 [Planctomycetota bacterium]|nr:hypothetical protein [Planctomycetota bacterium]
MFIQQQVQPDMYDMPMPPEPSFAVGQIIAMLFGALLFNLLFAFWGKSRAEDNNVHPLIGFLLGFFMGWIGVLIVPVFKSNRIFVEKRVAQTNMTQPYGQNPIYGQGQPHQQPNQPTQNYPQAPMQQQGFPQQPRPQAPPMQHQPPQQHQPQQQQMMLVADENGYVECPNCQARSKSSRRSCMSCGTQFPEIYDPNF